MASDVNITSSAVNVVAQLDVEKSYAAISQQLAAISKRINETGAFQVKLNMSAADMESINKMVLLGEQKKLTALQAQKVENEWLLGIKKQETEEARKQKILAEAQRAALKAAAQEAKTKSADTLAASNFKTRTDSWLLSHKDVKNYSDTAYAIRLLNKELKDGNITVAEANAQFNRLKLETKRVGIEADTFGHKFATAAKRMIGVYDSIGAIVLALSSLRTAVRYVTELDSVMVDLQIASGKSADEVGRMMESYHELAKEIGATSVEVAKASDGWLRQGYSAAEANELIRNSTMLAKLGQMEAEEATSALTSAMKGYKLGVEEAEHIVDKFAATDMNAAVSAGYLATAMAQTAVGANKMGIDFDTLTGYIATVGEVTQQSAESVGNFFKTLVARMGNIKAGNLYDPESAESLSDVETVLKGAGIALRDSQDEFRNFKDVLDDVAREWNNYSSVQQRAIAVAFSGTRQQERFMVLMENYGKAMDLAGVSANSAGTAVEKYGAYLDSIGAKSAAFKSAVYDLADSFVDSGLVKDILDIGTGVVNITAGVIDLVGVLPTLLGLIGAIKGVKAASAVFEFSKALLNGEETLGKLLIKFPALQSHLVKTIANEAIATGSTSALGLSFEILSAKVLKATGAIGSFLVTNAGTIAAMAAPIALIWALVAAQKAQEKETAKTREAYKESAAEVEDYTEKLKAETEARDKLKEAQDISYSASRAEQIEEQNEIIKGLEDEIKYLQQIRDIRLKDSHNNAEKSLSSYTTQDGGYSRSGITGADIIANEEMKRLAIWSKKIEDLKAEMRADPEKGASDKYIEKLERYQGVYNSILMDMESGVISFITTTMEGLNPDSETYKIYTNILAEFKRMVGDTKNAEDNIEESLSSNTAARTFHDIANAMAEVSTESDVLAEAISKLKDSSFDEVFSDPEKLNNLLEKFPELEDEVRAYGNGLMSTEELQKQFNAAIAQFRGDQIADALQDVVDAAERYGDESNVVIEKIEELDKIIPGLSQALIDENGQLRDNAAASLSSAAGLLAAAKANKDLAVAANSMSLEKARAEIDALSKYAVNNVFAMRMMEQQMLALQEKEADIAKEISDALGSVKFPTSSSSASSLPSAYEKAVKELDHLRAMDLISEEEYYRRLEALADKYLKGKSKYLDEYRSVQEKLWAYQKELYERQRDAEIEAAENRADAQKKALEDQYDAEKEALEKRKDLLEDEKDAYKDLIDYKKDLLDDASDERAHDQRVAELNQDIAQIEAELAALALDNSAKANARRVELHDELMAKQKELEDEQWDWSVDNQKDALDKEYERYEKTIDAQIKLLEDQLDALEKSYDAQLDHIDSMLEANINAINSSFDALINRAADAAAQIQAIFASIDVSTSSGITGLQQGLVNSGYDIGNYGANKDGVDGVMGKMTTKGLQQYLNDLQNSGVINFGDDLKIDGKVGSKTRNAIDAAIAAGYLNASFDKLHTGGIVGQKSSRNDLDIIKELVPLNDNEVWAKLLKKEMVLTEGQQEAVREAFRSIAAIKSATNTDVSKSRTLAGSVVQNNSPVFTIHNVFEGDVDADTLRRLDEWGNKFKKDVQNGVFKTMNQQNKFAGKTPVKTI